MSNAKHSRYNEFGLVGHLDFNWYYRNVTKNDFTDPLHPMVSQILFKGEPAVEDKSGACDTCQSGTARLNRIK